jgi:hypothetical protein
MKRILAIIFITIFTVWVSFDANSFEVGTHRDLSKKVVGLSPNLNAFFDVNQLFQGRSVIDWIAEGSDREDDGLRFCNHFHNPLRTWSQAGLHLTVPIVCGVTNESAVIWGQNLAQEFSWQKVRDEYFNGLTAASEDERNRHLANTFRGIGQLIHLVQDAAQPAHTRDDPHPIFKGLESYVENIRLGTAAEKVLFNSWINSSSGFDQAILTLSQNPVAPIPVARITDSTDPEQASAVPSAGLNQGLAEYSNANFLSEDTIFKDFTFPRVQSLGASFDGVEPVTGRPRRYYPKVTDGETVNRFIAEGTWTETLGSIAVGDQGYILDRGVLEDYAGKLLPRAIGYSAGLIDYFFRGKIDLQPSSSSQMPPTNIPPTTITPSIANVTPDEETGNGILRLVLQYAGQFNTSESFPQIVVSNEISQNITRSYQNATFPFSSLPVPATHGPTCFPSQQLICYSQVGYNVLLVYRGLLGKEDDSVIVSACSLNSIRSFYTFGELVTVGFSCFDS